MGRQLLNLCVLLGAIGVPLLAQFVISRIPDTEYTQVVLFKVGLNVTLAVSLSLIIGFTGQFSLGHGGFMSMGAFFSSLFSAHVVLWLVKGMDPAFLESPTMGASLMRCALLLLTVVAGMIAAIVASFIVGLPSLRLRGDYLAIATLGFGEIAYNLVLVYLQRTVSDTAFYLPGEVSFLASPVTMASSWILALLAILIVRNLVNSTAGKALPAIREDEIAASAVGIRTTQYKMVAFVVSAALAGAAGVLEAHQTVQMNPASYRFDRSIEMIVPIVLGGAGSLTGSVLAAAGFTYLVENLRMLPSEYQQFRTIVYAATLVLVMILRPQGLLGRWELRDLWQWLVRRSQRSQPIAEGAPATASAGAIRKRNERELTCSGLTIRFGGLTAVSDFNLCLKPREIVGLIGPNGAGKTTCFNMITGIYRPTEGEIRLGNRSIVGLGSARTNNLGIARTFQNIRLFAELSVLDNVRIALNARLRAGLLSGVLRTSAFYKEERRTEHVATSLLRMLSLDRLANEQAGSLPYGDQRRLEIARALATTPGVLCLDEPAAGMNPVEKRDLMALIRRIRDEFQLTVLLIEHDMRVVMGVCERIIVLDHGETIAEGAPEVIRDDPRVVEAYLGGMPA